MRDALGRRPASVAGAFAFAAVIFFSSGPAGAQPRFTEGNWGTADGGAVEVKADGNFDMAFTDATTKASLFVTGRVISKKPTPDGKLELTLKPNGSSADVYLIDLDATGNGEMFAVKGGDKHSAATLTK